MNLKHLTRWAALAGIAAITLTATGVAFAQSYDGLKIWADHHGLSGGWSIIWPLQVDAFILIGELALYVAVVERWHWTRHLLGWTVTLLGGVVSTLGNVGHVGGGHTVQVYGTAAVPPIAATAGLAIGLQVLKWTLNLTPPRPLPVPLRIVTGGVPKILAVQTHAWKLAPSTAPIRTGNGTRPRALPAPRPARAPASTNGTRQWSKHARYAEARSLYAASVDEGEALSQRELAALLGMKNRELARAVIHDHQKGTP